MIDLRYVKKLIEMLDGSSVDSVEISTDKGMKIRISKTPHNRGAVQIPTPVSVPAIMPQATVSRMTPTEAMPTVRDNEQSPADKFRSDAMWSLVQALAFSRSIDPNLIASRQEITELYKHLTNGAPRPKLLEGWRGEAVGETVLEMVKSQKPVSLKWDNGLSR